MAAREFRVLEIALSGWYGTTADGARVSSYDKRIERKYSALVEGGVVLDKRPAFGSYPRGAMAEVMDGPMLDLDLAPKGEERCPEPSAVLLHGLQDGFLALAKKRATDQSWRGLDAVGLDVYLSRWRVLGARIGVRHGDAIHWEDGEQAPIRE